MQRTLMYHIQNYHDIMDKQDKLNYFLDFTYELLDMFCGAPDKPTRKAFIYRMIINITLQVKIMLNVMK